MIVLREYLLIQMIEKKTEITGYLLTVQEQFACKRVWEGKEKNDVIYAEMEQKKEEEERKRQIEAQDEFRKGRICIRNKMKRLTKAQVYRKKIH